MDLNALHILTLVARHGSFASAARALDMDPSSVSRTVTQVETELGVRLFQRSTRALQETEEGAAFLSHIGPLLDGFDQATEAVRQISQTPSGRLKMTASVSFAQICVVPHLPEFLGLYPEIELELVPSDTNLDLIADGIDLAIRLAPAPKGDLISTKLRATRYVVCAAPGYLSTHPGLSTPGDLEHHDCLCFALPNYRTQWRFRRDGQDWAVPIKGRLVMSNALALRQAALDGLGPALMPDWLVDGDIATGALTNLFPDHDCTATEFDTGAWALYPSRAYLPQKVRVMIDFLRAKLA